MEVPESIRPTLDILGYEPKACDVAWNPGSAVSAKRWLYADQTYTHDEWEAIAFMNFPGLPPDLVLRYIYACNWNLFTAKADLIRHIHWRRSAVSDLSAMYAAVKSLLPHSGIYIHGRDTHHRPTIIVRLGKIDVKRNLLSDYLDLLVFL
jgi:hypothetical protein